LGALVDIFLWDSTNSEKIQLLKCGLKATQIHYIYRLERNETHFA